MCMESLTYYKIQLRFTLKALTDGNKFLPKISPNSHLIQLFLKMDQSSGPLYTNEFQFGHL